MVSQNPNSSFVLQPQVNEDTGEVINSIVKPYGIGIDCHSRFFQVCILIKKSKEGEENVLRFEFDFNTHHKSIAEAKEKVFDVLCNNGITEVADDNLHYTCESTGPYHRPLVLVWRGKPSIVNPVLATPSRRKTDVLDARLLAHYDITGLFPVSYIQNEYNQANKQLLSYYNKLKKNATQATNKIVNCMTYFGNTICARGKATAASIRPYIEDLCNGVTFQEDLFFQKPPEHICKMILQLYENFDECCNQSVATRKLLISNTESQTFRTDKGQISGKKLISLLTTVPGIGEFTAVVFLTEIGDIYRFPTPKALVAYCGFDPSLKVSAGKTTSHTVRKGNKFLHSSIMRCAGIVLNKKNEPLGKWGYSIMAKSPKGGWKKACGAIGRRIITSFYYIWQRQENFTTEKYMFSDFRDVENKPLAELGFTKRTFNLLAQLEIKDSKMLLHYYKNALLIRKGIGTKTIQEIDLCLKNLTLRPPKQMSLPLLKN